MPARGEDAFARLVSPASHPENDGKFVAIDVESGAYEEDEHAAVSRLHARVPGAQSWLVRAGYPATHRLRGGR